MKTDFPLRPKIQDRYKAIYHDYKEYFQLPERLSENDVVGMLASEYGLTRYTIRIIVDTMRVEERKGGRV